MDNIGEREHKKGGSMPRLALKYQQLAANVSLALSTFLVAYLLLHDAPAGDYGSFAFVLVLQGLGMALINALVASPLLILMNSRPHPDSADAATLPAIKGFFILGLAISGLIALLQGGYLWQATSDLWLSMIMASAGGLQLIRWYCRCEWQNRQVSVLLRSDLLFSSVLVVSVLLMWWWHELTLQSVAMLLLVSVVVALQPFVGGLLNVIGVTTDWQATKKGFDRQGKPALFGVLTVEATANFHSYLIVLLSGSIAFAPIAAAMLFFRPLAVVLGSLQQSERPLLVKALTQSNFRQIANLTQQLWRAAISAFLLNILTIVLVYWLAPGWLWPDSDSRHLFVNAVMLWSFIALLRALRSPASALLQAADQFNALAKATYASAILTVPLVLVSWWFCGPIASLLGVLAAELLLGLLLLRLLRQMPENKSAVSASD
ncbi:MAG: hypothetical protein KJ930_16610 [Gammaproteobacteria bacterium]|nr:hypothetical protein [Gammaproteobacteria bacterium]MBU2280793.1 hypothetical protein [Gammaproteobacteria bacterium]